MTEKPESIEIRVTRPWLYSSECQDPKYMEGHFFKGVDYAQARSKAEARFPHETLHVQITRRLLNDRWELV